MAGQIRYGILREFASGRWYFVTFVPSLKTIFFLYNISQHPTLHPSNMEFVLASSFWTILITMAIGPDI
jgi:hypothetical protein